MKRKEAQMSWGKKKKKKEKKKKTQTHTEAILND